MLVKNYLTKILKNSTHKIYFIYCLFNSYLRKVRFQTINVGNKVFILFYVKQTKAVVLIKTLVA